MEIQEELIKIITKDNKTFIINKQESLNEIWLSSPISGPQHFKFSHNQ